MVELNLNSGDRKKI